MASNSQSRYRIDSSVKNFRYVISLVAFPRIIILSNAVWSYKKLLLLGNIGLFFIIYILKILWIVFQNKKPMRHLAWPAFKTDRFTQSTKKGTENIIEGEGKGKKTNRTDEKLPREFRVNPTKKLDLLRREEKIHFNLINVSWFLNWYVIKQRLKNWIRLVSDSYHWPIILEAKLRTHSKKNLIKTPSF